MVDYNGFPSSQTAELVVDMKYRAPAGKQFRAVRETGSPLLLNKVLKELLVSEKQASDEQHRNSSGLTRENYDLQFVVSDVTSPIRSASKAAFPKQVPVQGKVWVDVTDYAVSRVVAEPEKKSIFLDQPHGNRTEVQENR